MTERGDVPDHPINPALRTYLLGLVDFEGALRLQRRLHFEVTGNRREAALILCEHLPIFTVGRQGSRANIRIAEDELSSRSWRIRWVNRGGGCVLHVPGQLAIYPVLPLNSMKLTISQYLKKLSTVIQETLADFSVRAEVRDGGVWVRQRLIAAMGVTVRDWVSYFGAYLNIQPDLELFRGFRCSEKIPEPMTSLERERKGPVRGAMIRESLLAHFVENFGFHQHAVFTDHPSLQNQVMPWTAQAFLTGSMGDRPPSPAAGIPTWIPHQFKES